jgi:hypothetical protein
MSQTPGGVLAAEGRFWVAARCQGVAERGANVADRDPAAVVEAISGPPHRRTHMR